MLLLHPDCNSLCDYNDIDIFIIYKIIYLFIQLGAVRLLTGESVIIFCLVLNRCCIGLDLKCC